MKKIINFFRKISQTKLALVLSPIMQGVNLVEYFICNIIWRLKGKKKPSKDETDLMQKNVTFIFKSFERQKMAKRLYKNIQSYYPEINVVIADDSSKPLNIKGKNLKILQLPFNSGLSYGINRALEEVKTPYVIRMDDDELLTPYSCYGEQLLFLQTHNNIDLVGIMPLDAPLLKPINKTIKAYYKQTMKNAPRTLLIPHLTRIDKKHIVVAKPPNIFIARTEKLRLVGYDDKIRMIDHNEFFYRAAGQITCALDEKCFVFHNRNIFNKKYNKYRNDIDNDIAYIRKKHSKQNKLTLKK